MRQTYWHVAILLSAAFLLQSCYYVQPLSAPIETINYPFASERISTPRDLLILLPGLGEYAESFEREGFVAVLRQCDLSLDAIAVNAHVGFYSAGSLVERLRKDVVEPALAKGYQRIHFAGISLGGYGSLLYMRKHPEHVTSALLLAPYLGEPAYFEGLLSAENADNPADNPGAIWPWLANLPERLRGRLYLGFGESDDYAESHRRLRRYLPPGHTVVADGAHDWPTWQVLWRRLLSRSPLASEPEMLRGKAAQCFD